jgi:hypothetical protein
VDALRDETSRAPGLPSSPSAITSTKAAPTRARAGVASTAGSGSAAPAENDSGAVHAVAELQRLHPDRYLADLEPEGGDLLDRQGGVGHVVLPFWRAEWAAGGGWGS